MDDSDPGQFRRIYDEHVDTIYRYVARRLPPGAGSEVGDVVADVFVVAWRRRGDDRAAPASRAWLLGVARRVLADHRRSDARRARLLERLRGERRPVAPSPPSREHDRLDEALERLRPTDQELVRLLAFEELTREEAAEVLGCTVNALNIRLHRAVRQLARELEHAGSATSPSDRTSADDGAAREREQPWSSMT